MLKELQTLKEKLKDIQIQVGAALTIIDEAEQVLSRLRREGGKLSEDKSSFLEFIKNEISPNKEEDKTRILEFVKSHKASGCSESHFSDVATYLFGPEDHDYVESLLKEMSDSRQIVYRDGYAAVNEAKFVKYSGWAGEAESKIAAAIFDYVESGSRVCGLESVTIGEIVEHCFDNAYSEELILRYVSEMEDDKKLGWHKIGKDKVSDYPVYLWKAKEKEKLAADDILKYLQKKPQGATLKQIQSRFKGYSKSSCLDIFNLVIANTEFILEDNVHISKAKVSVC